MVVEKIFENRYYIFTFSLLSPLEQRSDFELSLVELAWWFWSRRQKWEQFTKMSTTTTQTKTTLFTNVQQDWPSFKFRPLWHLCVKGFPCWGQTNYVLSFNIAFFSIVHNIYNNNYLKTCAREILIKKSKWEDRFQSDWRQAKLYNFWNIWIQTIKKTVFTKEDAHRYKNAMLQTSFTRGFAGTVTRPLF